MGIERDVPWCSVLCITPSPFPCRPLAVPLLSGKHISNFFGGRQGDGLVWNLAWKIISSPQIRNRIIIQGLVLEEVVYVIPQQ